MWYSKTGDDGVTDLLGGVRVAKDAPRIEALGNLDEATSAIGLARALAARAESRTLLVRIQREFYLLMAEVAAPAPEKLSRRIGAAEIAALEADIAALAGIVPQPAGFIVPGDSPGAGALDLARAVVRRAERRVVGLLNSGEVKSVDLARYLNRLSSLLHLLARADDRAAGVEAPTRV